MKMNKPSPKNPLLEQQLRQACTRIAPVWPLDRFVAVNPYLGMIDAPFTKVATTLNQVAGARMTLPTADLLAAYDAGRFGDDDLRVALAEHAKAISPSAFIATARAAKDHTPKSSVPTVADLVDTSTGCSWTRFMTERVSAWASSYFDAGQAHWRPAQDCQPFEAWRSEAAADLSPELMGAPDFRKHIRALPEGALAAAEHVLRELAVPEAGRDLYLHRLLRHVGGWAAYAARIAWDKHLYHNQSDDTVFELLCIMLAWEWALYKSFSAKGLEQAWQDARERLAAPASALPTDASLSLRLTLQRAYEHAQQREILTRFNSVDRRPAPTEQISTRPAAQAVFCIDVRSEVFRRHLETANPDVKTLGFAGFFAFPIELFRLGHTHGQAQCPVLLSPTHQVKESAGSPASTAEAIKKRSIRQQAARAWYNFKMGAVSCFSFVGPIGLSYLPKLLSDGFGLTRPVAHPDTSGLGRLGRDRDISLASEERQEQTTGIPLQARIALAKGALQAMSLTDNFARLVMITGHGSSTVNNPHASGLDCGACGGRTGEANARVAATVLNDKGVRQGLTLEGINIPADTFFLACQHDTTTDQITLFNASQVPEALRDDLKALRHDLALAAVSCRRERAARLHLLPGYSTDLSMLQRSRDWAQVRPEWGLAGCAAFVVAPRHHSVDLDLEGRAFLHTYDWQKDDDFAVLELIMTAPMVVASWISLQYYASTVDPELFGAGNKTLHNIVGTVGVFEGNGGDLRIGLPWQSVHDGTQLQHAPTRLNVLIAAPTEAISGVIAKHKMLRDLLDNGWLHLFAMDEAGRVTQRYQGQQRWAPLQSHARRLAA